MKIKISELKLAKYNPRTISDKEMSKIKLSLEEFGFLQEVIINKDSTVISGHQRIRAWKELGHKTVPCVKVDITKNKEKALNLAMNRLGGEWDPEKLYDVIDSIRSKEEIKFTGFDDKEISKVLDMKLEMEEELGESPEIEAKEPVAKQGDVYELGEHRLMCGDCTIDMDSLMEGKLADMVWTDPPYNVDYESTKEGKIKNDKMGKDNFAEFTEQVFTQLSEHMKKGAVSYICSGWQSFAIFQEKMEITGIHLSEIIIWVKNRGGIATIDFPHKHEQIIKARNTKKKKGEAIFYGWKEGANHKFYGKRDDYDVWEVDRLDSSEYIHPTEKPDWLVMKALKNSSKENDIVLDVFGGSGSALIACEKMGRKARIMELDPKFVDRIIKRWENFTGKKAKKLNK